MQKEYSDWDARPIEPMDEVIDFEFDEMLSDLPIRTIREEWLNTWSHGVFAGLSILASLYMVYLAVQSGTAYALESALVYGLTMTLMYTTSAVYHGAKSVLWKKRWRIMDHCAIFLFIAGNYTPLLLLIVGGEVGWTMVSFLWSMAAIGVLLKIKFTGRYDWCFIALFVAMAWIGAIQGNYLYHALPTTGFNLLWIGGVVYMLGVFFYKMEGRIPYAHLIWHLFVIGGCSTHYWMMIRYVFA